MSSMKIVLILLVVVTYTTYTVADDDSVAGLSLEGTLGDTGELVDDTLNGLNLGKREAPGPEPEVKTRILGMLTGMLGRKKRQADPEIKTRIVDGLLGRKKRQADPEIKTRIVDGLLGRKKRELSIDQVIDIANILQE